MVFPRGPFQTNADRGGAALSSHVKTIDLPIGLMKLGPCGLISNAPSLTANKTNKHTKYLHSKWECMKDRTFFVT